MAQILKYSGGGTSPKPIKIGSKYYTKELLMTDLYGDKLDEYIKFREFNSKEAANFRKNLDNQVNALIDGRLTLNGNTLIDSKGEWSNTGEYAKPKLFGKLNEEQIKNNESLDVANYLVRALNSNKIATYVAPSEYNLFESDTFKTYNDMLEDTDWLNEDVTKRRNLIAKSLEDEANKLEDDSNYQGKYSYEGWQDVDWDTRANATILKLRDAAKTLKDSTINGLDLKLKLGLLGYGDLANYLEKEEKIETPQDKQVKQENQDGLKNPEGTLDKESQKVSVGWEKRDAFNFSAPVFIYNGKRYVYGTDEYKKLLALDPLIELSDGTKTHLSYFIKKAEKDAKQIDRAQTTFYTPVPAEYNYFNNVTDSFVGTEDLHSAYLLRKDALNPEGSILRLIFNNPIKNHNPLVGDYFFDPEKIEFYKVEYDKNNTPIRGKKVRLPKTPIFRQKASVTQIIKPTGNNDVIFNGIADLRPEQLYKQFSDYIKTHYDEINTKTGSSKLKGMYLGSINRILEETKKGTLKNISGTMRNSGDKLIFIKTADKLVVIHLKKPLENNRITYDNLIKIEVKKEGGKIVKAQAGVKVDVLEEPSLEIPLTYEIKLPKTYKTPKTPTGRNMPISRKEQRLQEAVNGEFSAHDSARLALSLIDLGSAVFGVLPGTSALSTATGVASSLGTAVADYTDDKVGFWNATGNLVMNLGLDAASLVPGLKSLKVGKALKFIGNVLPRAIGAFWGYGLIKDENQKNLLLSTGKKIAEGDFGKLTTLDFENITTLIRMATLGARDVASVRNRKPGNVVITGKVGDTEVKTTVKGDDVKGTLGRRMKGLNPRFKSKAKQKLVEDVNKSSVDAEGNSMGWKPDDITDFKTEVIPVGTEYKPKAFMENIFGLGNKGFNWVGSDKWIATHFPKYHRGMVTDADVVRMRDTYTDSKYAELNNYFPKDSYSNRRIRDLMNNGRYDTELRNKKAAERRKLIDSGSIEASKLTDYDINRLTNDVINDNGVKIPDNIEDLVKQAKTSATVGGYFDKNLFETELLRLIRGYKQGGRIERGLSLINAYKSGGLVIPKFDNSGKITLKYLYNPDVYYVNDIADYNTTTLSGNQLTDIWAKKGTNSLSGLKAGIYDYPNLKTNITHLLGLEHLKKYVSEDKWVEAVQKYIKENGAYAYNLNISKLRKLRARFEGKEHLYKNEDVAEYNKLFNDIFGDDYHKYSDELDDIYGLATNLRHVLSFASTKDKDKERQFTIGGTKYWLDNAGYVRTGEYGKPKVIKPEQAVEDSQNVLVNGAKTENGAGGKTKTGGRPGGSKQYISDVLKFKTKINPIQLLRMAELAGALGTNAAATNELLKYRSYGLNPFWRQTSLSDKYPLIAATQNQSGSFYTQLKNPTTADLGSYLASLLAGYSKGFTAMLNAYNENYNTFLTSKAGVQEAANYNNAAEVEASNNNVARAVTAENMKDKVRADLYSTNFAQGIKPFLSETRQYMQDAAKLRLKAEYDVLSAIAKQKYDNDIAAINENYVRSIDKDFLKANEGKSDYAIIQAWLTAHPDKTKEYKALLETPTMDYYKNQAKLYEILAPNIGFLNTTTLAYNYESGGKLTAKDRIKILKIKDYNAARRLDSKESLKSITKDKEEFGKNYRALSAGTLKMLERTLK